MSSLVSSLPSGTVTFLFTDIKGSTKLAQEYPDKWESLRERHHAILQAAIESYHGYVFQIIGDAFCVAFHTAIDGLNAAVEAQRKLQNSDWGETPIKVRMGIHTGSAESRGADYRGYLTMAKVQRVMSVAYGGQILLSNASFELIRGDLSPHINLLDIGEHRLKGIINPEHLWQVCAPDLPQDFPPLPSLNSIPNNLPVQLTSFIGREKEITEIKQELEAHRLVTLTGSGGTGKTRLSLQVAAEELPNFRDGAWLVELAPLTDSAILVSTIASVFALREVQNIRPINTLLDYLRAKQLLLILDNCEHLVEASAQIANQILQACPQVKLVASSRESLNISGEAVYRVQPLLDDEARQLFIERATNVEPRFHATENNASFIAQICVRLDGIPLAIELAAARIKIMSIEQISARLDDRFRLLTGGTRTALPRQQTLRALIDWSYDILIQNEQLLLQRLSVFAGGWTLEAAESVCAGDGISTYDVLDLLSNLVSKSLVNVLEQSNQNETRYSMLETIRQYAHEKLIESEEAENIRARHLDFFVGFAEAAGSKLRGPEQLEYLNQVEIEYDNIRAALEESIRSGDAVVGLQIAWSLTMFWSGRGYWTEARGMLTQLLAQPRAMEESPLRVKGLIVAGLVTTLLNDRETAQSCLEEGIEIASDLGSENKYLFATALGLRGYSMISSDLALARALCEQALAIGREINDAWVIANVLDYLGNIYVAQGDYDAAYTASTQSMTCFQAMKNRWLSSRPLGNLGSISFQQGDYESARSYWEAALGIYQEIGDRANTAFILGELANIAEIQGDFPRSAELYEESLAIRQAMGDEFSIAPLLATLGHVWLQQGNTNRAATLFTEGLALNKKIENQTQVSICLIGFAALAITKKQPDWTAQLLGMANGVTPDIEKILSRSLHTETEKLIETVRSALGDTAYPAAYEAGKQMSLDEAIAYALKELGQ